MSIALSIVGWSLTIMVVVGAVFYWLVRKQIPLFRPKPPAPLIPTPVTDAMVPWVIGNFVLYFVLSSLIGGDAVNGHLEGGRHFVSGHGQLTEVSRSTWSFNLIHTYLTIVSFFALMVVKAVEHSRRRCPNGEE